MQCMGQSYSLFPILLQKRVKNLLQPCIKGHHNQSPGLWLIHHIDMTWLHVDKCVYLYTKVELIWEPALNQQLTGFPANIWIFKLFFLMVFAIKMLLNNSYGLLNLLEFVCNHFDSLFQAGYEFKNSNFGGKSSELLIQCWFTNKFDFSTWYLYDNKTHKSQLSMSNMLFLFWYH